MALLNTLDHVAVADRMGAWLTTVLDGARDVRVTDVHVPRASGMSSESVLLTAAWERDGAPQEQALVARVAPTSGGLFEHYDLAREGRVMDALARHTDVPAPAVVAHEPDGTVLGAPFLLMERCFGEVPADDPPFTTAGWVVDLSDEQRARMYDNALGVLAGIHTADWETLGLGDLAAPDLGATPLDQQFAHWERFYALVAGDRPSPTIDAALEWAHANRPADEPTCVISWGDARLGNLMFGPDQEVSGVFDWEMATLGSHELDLGWFLFLNRTYTDGLGVPVPGGFPGRAATIARYEELSGLAVRDIDFYEGFAGLRGAIILMRVGRMMIELGLLPEDAALPFSNPASMTLATLLDLPVPTAPSAWITGHR